MKNLKNIAKSVRMTEEVCNYVNSFHGNGFNEKFENLVLFCLKEEKEIKNKISVQNDIFKQNQKKIERQNRILKDLDSIQHSVKYMLDSVSKMECNSNHLQLELAGNGE